MKYPDVQKIIDILEKVKSGENARGFDMNHTHTEEEGLCGSACCIGGHAACAIDRLKLSVEEALSIFCNIPLDDAHGLCWPGMWKSPETNNYINISCTDVELDDAIEHLKWYMNIGVVDWTPYVKKDEEL